MHDSSHATPLPWVEYRRLQGLMLTMIGGRTAFAAMLRRKLGSTAPALPPTVSPEIAVSGGRVQFRVDGREVEERVLSWRPNKRDERKTLSLLSPRGLALLGLSPGSKIAYRTESGRTEFLEVERVSNVALDDGGRASPDLKMARPAVDSPVMPPGPAVPSTALAGGSNG